MAKNRYPQWLNSAIFYQIYPQSFYDSNGDGIGDIPGIIQKLDYVKSLGCNAIWLNPCFVSPFNDAGYDVADYYKVAPRYGTNNNLKRLFKTAHKKGIRVVLDLVPGHTSNEHSWFKESCKVQKNKYTNRYIWTDNIWGLGGESFGEFKTVSGFAQRHGVYVTNFFWSQPALNYGFANPDPNKKWQLPVNHPSCLAMRKELVNIMRYWLGMGADGFRVDMAFSLVKNDPGYSATIKLWQKVCGTIKRDYPDAALISEWFCPTEAIQGGFDVDFARPAHDDDMLRGEKKTRLRGSGDVPSFFRKDGKGDMSKAMTEITSHLKKIKKSGHLGLYTGNHDIPRISVGRLQKEIELVFAFILTMPCVPFVYYGDEIGMKYQRNLPSKEGGFDRTGCRTPMQWSAGKNAGFSCANSKKLYLPFDSGYKKLNVERQDKNSRSLLNRVRELTALRKNMPALQIDAEFRLLYCEPNKYPLIYLRSIKTQKTLIAINPSDKITKMGIQNFAPKFVKKTVAASGVNLKNRNGKFVIEMKPISYGIFELE